MTEIDCDLPFFLKSPHYLFSVKVSHPLLFDCRIFTFQVSVNPLKITDCYSKRVYEVFEQVIEDSSGPRVYLWTLDGNYRIEIPYYGSFPPVHGSFVMRKKDGDEWICTDHGDIAALAIPEK